MECGDVLKELGSWLLVSASGKAISTWRSENLCIMRSTKKGQQFAFRHTRRDSSFDRSTSTSSLDAQLRQWELDASIPDAVTLWLTASSRANATSPRALSHVAQPQVLSARAAHMDVYASHYAPRTRLAV